MNFQAWTAALSIAIAAAAFTCSMWAKYSDQRQASLRDWQRVVIYSILEEGQSSSFDALQSRYLQKAQQLLSQRIPRKEIQEAALSRILLDLQRDGVVIRMENAEYQVQKKAPIEAWSVELLNEMANERRLKPIILSIIEKENGVYTPDSLVRKLHAEGFDISFEDLDALLYQLRGYTSLKLNREGRLESVLPFDERQSLEERQKLDIPATEPSQKTLTPSLRAEPSPSRRLPRDESSV
jgi:hypothetical protein